jgi:hypothetical protein
MLYAKAQLFKRLTVTKNAVYTNHDLNGMTRGLRNNDRGPHDSETKFGKVNTAVTINCAKVIRGPSSGGRERVRDRYILVGAKE